jgi:hypothetical protein
METEKPIAVYTTSRKKIVREGIIFLGIIALQSVGHTFKIISLDGGAIWLNIIALFLFVVLLAKLYKYTVVEVYENRVTIKKPVFKKSKTVFYKDFQKIQFNENLFLFGHYHDKVRKMKMAEFLIDYSLFKNYQDMVVQIWTRISCPKFINNAPAETDDIFKALKMKTPELTTSL